MTNYEKFVKTFPNIPDLSGFDLCGDFWEEEYCEDKNIAKRVEKLLNSIKNDKETPDDAQMSDEDMAKYVAKLRDSIKLIRQRSNASMTDKKQVMSWLEGLTFDDWHMYHSDSEVQEIAKAAFALMEEQEAKLVLDIADSVEGIVVGKCPRCDRTIVSKQSDPTQFCKYCGQAVKWDV